tara:strand:+ start:178 stop:984 length:807 start_codon:yes stop_codon:yes gene_type:complete
MASKITINVKPLIDEIDKYSPKSLRNSTYVAAKEIGFLIAKNSQKGLPFEYKKGKVKFIDPVPFTLNSFLSNADKNKVTISVKDEQSKGNSPANYLYPVIGGGSNKAFETRFTKYLHRKGFASSNQYPLPNKGNEFIKTTGANQRVLGHVYANTQRALNKTLEGGFKSNFIGPKFKAKKVFSGSSQIQNGRVFSVKFKGQSKFKKLEPGIYRVKTEGGEQKLAKLFTYTNTPNVKPKAENFKETIERIARREFKDILIKNIQKRGKSA